MNNSLPLFCFSRMALVVKHDIIGDWRKHAATFLVLFAVLVLPMLFLPFTMVEGTAEEAFELYCQALLAGCVLVFNVGAMWAASHILDPMQTKQQRIAYLMLPATHLEKFLARFLQVTVGFFLLFMVALGVAELVRYLALPLYDLPAAFQQTVLFPLFKGVDLDGARMFTYIDDEGLWSYSPVLSAGWEISCWLLFQSLFVFGGCFWRKRSFIKVVSSLIAFYLLLVLFFVHSSLWLAEHPVAFSGWRGLHDVFSWMTLDMFLGGGIFLSCTVAGLCWWKGYRLFVRSQVVESKWGCR